MAFKWPAKDPNERLDYTHDFGPRLDPGDQIIVNPPPDPQAPEALVDAGDVTIDGQPSMENHPDTGQQTVMRVWLTGGTVKESGDSEKLTLRVHTQAGRILDEGILVPIRSR